MKRKASSIGRVVVVCLLALPCAEAVATIEVEPVPSADPTNLGQAMYVDVMIRNLGYYSLGMFSFQLEYDPAILSYTGHTLTGELGNISTGEATDLSGGDLGGGRIDLGIQSHLSDFSQQSDTFAMATVHFQAIGLGTCPLFPDPSNMLQGNGEDLLYVLYGGSVDVVPEPTAVGLFLLGGAALLRQRRR